MSPKKKSPTKAVPQPQPRQTNASPRTSYTQPARSRYSSQAYGTQNGQRRMVTIGIIGAGVLVALLVLLYSIEQRSPSPAAQSANGSQTSSGANVTALQDRLKQNPADVDAMIALGNEYYDAKFYTDAINWYEKALEKQPNNTDVRTDLGTAYFYSGQNEKAKEQWAKVFQQDPNKVQAHMNLGILYSNETPPDTEAAAKEWRTVIQLAPGSQSAQQAQSLLQKIGK